MRGLRTLLFCLCAAIAQPALAQVSMGEPVPDGTRILTVDQNRLYTGSRYGQGILSEIEAQTRALTAENRDLEAALETEEKALTERRTQVTPEEFQALAEAFDKKVNEIREARMARLRDLETRQTQAQRTFLQKVGPVLAQILTEKNADLIIDRSAVILLNARIDVTDLAIERIDATLVDEGAAPGAPAANAGGETQAPPEPTPRPAPEPTPEPAPGTTPDATVPPQD